MKKTKKPRILFRIISGYAILFLFFLLVSFLYLKKINETNSIVDAIIKHPFTVSNSTRDISICINGMHRTMKDVALSANDEELKKELKKVDELEKEVQRNLEIIKDRYLGNIDDVRKLEVSFKQWKPIREEVINQVVGKDSYKAINITRGKGADHVDTLNAHVQKLMNFAEHKASEYNERAQTLLKYSYRTSFIVILASLIFILIGMAIAYQSVNIPLKEIIKRIRKVSRINIDNITLEDENNILSILYYAVNDLEAKTHSLHEEIEERKATSEELYQHKKELKETVTLRTKELVTELKERKKVELELKTQQEELEKIVIERTEDLQAKNKKLNESKKAMFYLLEDVNEGRELLSKTNDQLQSTINELETFSYSVSHDLKAPLRAIIGFSQILVDDYQDQLHDDAKKYLTRVIDNAANMNNLINDLLQLSRTGRIEIRKINIDLNDLIQRIKNELLDADNVKNITFKTNDLPSVYADETLIYQVLLNLISNAIKFSSNNNNAIIEVGTSPDKNKTVFYIKDNGVGFDMKNADKIFNVFHRLHGPEEFEGTGIGLAIVQRIIHKHQGKIWVESEINQGTTFFFTLG